MAAQQGGGDVEFNVSLRYAVDAAKAANMAKDSIEKAIKKGTGADGSSERWEEVRYEGYAPGGVAILVDTLVSNPQKTAPEIRSLFDKNHGKLGQSGSVSFGFTHQGIALIDEAKVAEDQLMEVALEAGADDVVQEDGLWQVTCSPADFLALKSALEDAGIEMEQAEITWTPQTTVPCDAKTGGQVLRLIDAFDDHDDVQAVYHNADIPEEALSED